jgi:hypothetical protein
MNQNEIDIKALEERALLSPDEESFIYIEQNQNYSIGICARRIESIKIEYFIELAIPLCGDSDELDTTFMEKVLTLLKTLKTNRYEIICNEGIALCEKMINPSEIYTESAAIKKLLEERYCKSGVFQITKT